MIHYVKMISSLSTDAQNIKPSCLAIMIWPLSKSLRFSCYPYLMHAACVLQVTVISPRFIIPDRDINNCYALCTATHYLIKLKY